MDTPTFSYVLCDAHTNARKRIGWPKAPRILVWRSRSPRDKLPARVLSVVATKIRTSQGMGSLSATVGRIYEGYLLSSPVVGRGMVIFRDPNGRRMVTTAVRRVLTPGEDNILYVETENSVYRIAISDDCPAAVTATG